MRVVIDTNIWISGLLWRGLPWQLLRLAKADKVELCMATSMLDELAEVLTYKHLQPRLRQLDLVPAELVAYAMNLSTIFEVPPSSPVVHADPDDDIFVHCVVVAGAAYIVSGDRHLLDLREYANIPILTIRDFLARNFPKEIVHRGEHGQDAHQ